MSLIWSVWVLGRVSCTMQAEVWFQAFSFNIFLFLPKSEKASGCGSKSLGGRKAVLWKATPYLTGEELLTLLIRGRRLCYSIHNAETTGDHLIHEFHV